MTCLYGCTRRQEAAAAAVDPVLPQRKAPASTRRRPFAIVNVKISMCIRHEALRLGWIRSVFVVVALGGAANLSRRRPWRALPTTGTTNRFTHSIFSKYFLLLLLCCVGG